MAVTISMLSCHILPFRWSSARSLAWGRRSQARLLAWQVTRGTNAVQRVSRQNIRALLVLSSPCLWGAWRASSTLVYVPAYDGLHSLSSKTTGSCLGGVEPLVSISSTKHRASTAEVRHNSDDPVILKRSFVTI